MALLHRVSSAITQDQVARVTACLGAAVGCLFSSPATAAVPISLVPTADLCTEKLVECAAEPSPSARFVGNVAGLAFELFDDGSGRVHATPEGGLDSGGAWYLQCGRDPIKGHRTCFAIYRAVTLLVSTDGYQGIAVGEDIYPGTKTAIRIGKRVFTTTDKGVFGSWKQMTPLMVDGTPVATSYKQWPYRRSVDDEFTIHGALATVQVLQWTLRNSR